MNPITAHGWTILTIDGHESGHLAYADGTGAINLTRAARVGLRRCIRDAAQLPAERERASALETLLAASNGTPATADLELLARARRIAGWAAEADSEAVRRTLQADLVALLTEEAAR